LVSRKVVFAGAGPVSIGSPWGTLGVITKRALETVDYDVEIEPASFGADNPRFVSDGRCDLGATQFRAVREAFTGARLYEAEGPRPNLRLIATINQPAWIGVAVRKASGISDLRELAALKQVRVKTGGDRAFDLLLEYYGLSRERITPVTRGSEVPLNPAIRWAGRDEDEIASWVRAGNFDAIIDPIYAAYTPEHRHWWDASILHELRFLPLPDDLVRILCEHGEVEGPGFIPHRLMRGVNEDIPSAQRLPQVIYTRSEVPDEFVYQVVRALDKGRHFFRQTHIPYSYDPLTVALPRSVPLHSGAERYYREMEYLD
jgi:TRAP-type uncharacterized transport system substrate-binding protein